MSLKQNLGRSTAWMSLAAAGNSVISFIIFIVLSRILSATDIGLVAFALIVVEIGKIIVNAGFSQAVVQRNEWDNTYASTCFYLNVLFSVLVTLAIVFVAAPLVAYYYEPKSELILKVLSIIFFLEGIKAVHEGKLKREFSFRVIALRTVVASLLSGALGIYLAINGFGVWALVFQQLLSQLLITFVTIISAKWMPALDFSWIYTQQLLRFSTPLMFAQLIANVGSKIFEVLIGILMGPAALGFFRVGGRALYILQDVVLKPLENTTLSALARIAQANHQALSVMRVIRMSCYLIFPVFFGAAAIGPEFIVLAFGDRWALSGQIMMLLAIGVAPTVIGQQINAVLTASGNSRLVLVLAAITFVGNCIVGFLMVPFGLLAVALGFAARSYITLIFNLYFFKSIYHIDISYVLKITAPSFISSVIMLAGLLSLKLIIADNLSPAFLLPILGIVGVIIYTLSIRLIFKNETKLFLIESIDLLPTKLTPFLNTIQRLMKLT
jgi:O-antigen/teichoic acid export membrane protein